MTSCGLSEVVLRSGGAHNNNYVFQNYITSYYDVTQQAPWRPPCGVRRLRQKCLEQFYMGSQCHLFYSVSVSVSIQNTATCLCVAYPSWVLQCVCPGGCGFDQLSVRATQRRQ